MIKLIVMVLLLALATASIYCYIHTKKHYNFFLEELYVPSGDSTAPLGILQTPDGYILMDPLVVPSNQSPTSHHFGVLVIKLSDNGHVQHAEVLGGDGGDYGAYSIQQTADGGYILAGFVHQFRSNCSVNALVIKLNGIGSVQWAEALGGRDYEEAYSIQQIPDGYILAGTTKSFGTGERGVLIAKLPKYISLKFNCSSLRMINNLTSRYVRIHLFEGNVKDLIVNPQTSKIRLYIHPSPVKSIIICNTSRPQEIGGC